MSSFATHHQSVDKVSRLPEFEKPLQAKARCSEREGAYTDVSNRAFMVIVTTEIAPCRILQGAMFVRVYQCSDDE